ncbi:MAG: WYL domain-containing protein [Rhodospirillales bacterium]|nr:WYL domain-containing protein [Rhodospirillales bacterium]
MRPRHGVDSLFQRSQTMEDLADGTLTVRFAADGLDEICWHLVTFGESVSFENPARLRQRSVSTCVGLAAHHNRND